MVTAIGIPVSVEADAAARVEELGMEAEFQAMLAKLKEIVTGLRAIDVTLDFPPDYEDDPMILFRTYQPRPPEDGDPTGAAWRRWLIDTFPPNVLRHFVRLPHYEGSNGR